MEKEALELYVQKPDTTTISLAYASKERLRNYDNLKNSVNRIFDDFKETYYIPAGRSMITLLVNNRSLIENDNLDLITRQFMQIIDNIHGAFSDGIRNVHKRYPDGERKFDVGKISEMLISDLKGDYQYTAGKEYIVIQDNESCNEKIPINFASSGQQEVLWLLNQLYILMLKKENAFVIIEEPEAHLYPNLQNEVVEFIAYFANINNSSILITTHSPYILTSVNALYCAGKVIQEFHDLSKKVYDIIGNKCEIYPERVTAFKINKDTSVQNLVNDSFEEINTEMIDEISDSVNEKYIELFYLVSEKDVEKGE
ncbi:MAG: AAA family ATPase [Lachnospiraceae bacterium]|nr:AAA family ATPase [Lachnospiraceae bacterium]